MPVVGGRWVSPALACAVEAPAGPEKRPDVREAPLRKPWRLERIWRSTKWLETGLLARLGAGRRRKGIPSMVVIGRGGRRQDTVQRVRMQGV